MKVAIIGGAGKMGRWFAEMLLKDGEEVIISGRNRENLNRAGLELGVGTAGNAEAASRAELVLVSVPIDCLEGVIREIAPHLKPEQTVIEITSVKVLPTRLMRAHTPEVKWLGVHPMFGPGARSYRGQNFILTPADGPEDRLVAKVRDYLEARGGNVSVMSPERHDRMMTVILGLSHFIAIVTADCLLDFPELEQTRAAGSTTYKVLLDLVESVVAEDPALYAALQMNLPDINAVEEQFCRQSQAWADIVRRRDYAEFTRRMQALKVRFAERDPDFQHAYENLYRAADKGNDFAE